MRSCCNLKAIKMQLQKYIEIIQLLRFIEMLFFHNIGFANPMLWKNERDKLDPKKLI